MRKIIFIILTVIMCIIMGLVAWNGIGFANVLGINQIREENQKIKDKNDELSTLIDTSYPNAVKSLEDAENQLKTTKEEYESQIALNADSGTGYLATTEKYEIEYLWTRIGNHALDNDVDIKIDLTNSSTAGLYKLNFEVTGTYVGITDFIYSIENDSKLGFKIDKFVATANATTTTADTEKNVAEVKATYDGGKAKYEAGINIQSIESQTTTNSSTTGDATGEANNTNGTTSGANTTNTTTGTNTTNTSGTTNTTSNTTNSTTQNNTAQVNSTVTQ